MPFVINTLDLVSFLFLRQFLLLLLCQQSGVVFNLESFDVLTGLTGLCSKIDDQKCFDCLDYFMTSP